MLDVLILIENQATHPIYFNLVSAEWLDEQLSVYFVYVVWWYLLLVVVNVEVGGVHGGHQLTRVIKLYGVDAYRFKLRCIQV